jgi:penicillin-binding protein 1A
MVKHGYITQKECDDAKNVKVENMLCSSKITNSSVNAAYVDIVTDEVKKRTGLDPLKTQMNIYTYCNSETQALAAAIGNGEKYDYSDEDMRMGGAVQSSQDGRIVAVIGGRNYNFGNYNYATQKQQPGSSVKPFLDYGLAFENLDWSTGHSINDDDYYNGKFKNWDRQFHGLVTVENALENSWNIPAIKTFDEVQQKIGSDKIQEAMESIGISMNKESIGLASAIGGWSYGISPLEMAGAYATISNNGLYTESHTINYVEVVQTGETFNIDEEIQNNAKQSAYSKASAFMVRQVMLDYTKNGSGNYAYVSGIENVGAKTGTSNWGSSAKKGMAGKSRDLWMTAYTSNYICSVWMGFGQEGIEKGKTTSRYKAYPGKVVQTLLKHLQSKKGDKSYPSQPSTVVKDGDDYYKKGTKHEGHAAISEETTEETQTEENQTNTNENQSSETNNNSNNQNNNSNTNTENNGSSNNGTSTDNSGTSSGTTGGNTSGGSSGGNSSSSSGESSQPNPNTNQ